MKVEPKLTNVMCEKEEEKEKIFIVSHLLE